jgi:hypothetical protein
MDLLLSDIEPAFSESPQKELELARLTFAEVNTGFRPGWALAFSVIAHEIVLFSAFLVSVTIAAHQRIHPIDISRAIDLNDPKQVIYLPVVGGGSEGNGFGAAPSTIARGISSTRPTRSSKGFSFPGRQPVLSDPPKPRNPIQTLLRPGLKNPPVLPEFVPLPNTIHMADGTPPAPIHVKPANPAFPASSAESTEPIQPPKLTLPANALENIPLVPATQSPLPIAKAVQKPAESPKTEEVSALPTRTVDAHDLAALSAIPAPVQPPPEIPMAEARARFAVSPISQISAPPVDSGSKLEGTPSKAAAIGNQSGASAGDAVAQAAAAAGKNRASSSTNHGMPETAGTGTGKGFGTGETTAGVGNGLAAGAGLGSGLAAGYGSGAGAGNGPGRGGFPGVTIQRGSSQTGAVGTPHGGMPMPPQTSYRMTIVSTAGSGGGLSDFGVFSHEKVYTVYLDMKLSPEDRTPSWTLQYALVPKASEQASTGTNSSKLHDGVKPPLPLLKCAPHLPDELVHRYLHSLVVVYAILDTQGKLEQMSVRQSPDNQISENLLDALGNWVFRPAEVNGEPVDAKVLLGIPVTLSSR